MGWLFGKKNNNVIDLTERYRKQQAAKVSDNAVEINAPVETSQPTGFGIFGMSGSTTTTPSTESNSQPDDKRKKLARRIMAMTDKIEDLSNQIYHLQQRIEVLEKKGAHGY